ncbi:MAG TPA: ROK family protein [Thermodesulfobacteriota bacterium]|nr:ROK family protein [Thermodesulfobacteriota bacterium]
MGSLTEKILNFPPDSAVIGLDVGGSKLYSALSDLSGRLREERKETWTPGSEDVLRRIISRIDALLSAAERDSRKVLGVCVGAPGVTRADEGIVSHATALGWHELPLGAILSERFNLPVAVENDVNLAAVGEWGFGLARGCSSLALVAVGTGIGCGVVIDGKIHRGSHHSAGEIGYLPPDVTALGKEYRGFGPLESFASGPGIALRAEMIFRERGWAVPANGLSAEMIFQSAREGKDWALKVVDETVDYLCLAAAAISTVLDPDAIVIAGGVARSADLIIEPMQRKLKGAVPAPPRILASNLGPRAAVLGSVIRVVDIVKKM